MTLIVARTETEQASFLVMDSRTASRSVADHLANATGARAVPSELPDLVGDGVVTATVSLRGDGGSGRETQAGLDPNEASRLLAQSMRPGQWVAVTVRAARQVESRRYARWLHPRVPTGTHHSTLASAVVMSMHVGAATGAEARTLGSQVTAALPGFDLDTHVRVARPRLSRFAVLGAGLAAWAGLVFGAQMPGLGVLAALTGCTLAALMYLAGGGAVRRSLTSGRFPTPPALAMLAPWRGPRPAGTGPDGQPRPERVADYPMPRDTFRVGPHLPVQLVAPAIGALSGQAETNARPVPGPMREPVGVLIGHGQGDAPVHIATTDRQGGVILVGRKGSGKTELLNAVFAYDAIDRLHGPLAPGSVGPNASQIAFENKGEGARKYLEWAHAVGDRSVLVDAADPTSYAVDIFATGGTWTQRGEFFANALKYVLADGAIGPSSFMALGSFGAAALALLESERGRELLDRFEHTSSETSVMELAYIFVGGRGDDVAVSLDAEITAEANRLRRAGTPDAGLDVASAQLRPYYGGNPVSARREAVTPPRNKIYALLAVDHFWSPRRPKITWTQVLTMNRSVVVNTGPPVGGETDAQMLAEEITTQLSGMLLYSLRDAIMRHCSGWQAAGRAVHLYGDELALLAGTSPEVITWLHDQGRAFGVRTLWATQRPTQLHPQVRESAMDSSTVIAFSQANTDAAAPIVADLGADGSTWAPHDLVNLPAFSAAARSSVRGARQQAFTFSVDYFAADRAGFAARQGLTAEARRER